MSFVPRFTLLPSDLRCEAHPLREHPSSTRAANDNLASRRKLAGLIAIKICFEKVAEPKFVKVERERGWEEAGADVVISTMNFSQRQPLLA